MFCNPSPIDGSHYYGKAAILATGAWTPNIKVKVQHGHETSRDGQNGTAGDSTKNAGNGDINGHLERGGQNGHPHTPSADMNPDHEPVKQEARVVPLPPVEARLLVQVYFKVK